MNDWMKQVYANLLSDRWLTVTPLGFVDCGGQETWKTYWFTALEDWIERALNNEQ